MHEKLKEKKSKGLQDTKVHKWSLIFFTPQSPVLSSAFQEYSTHKIWMNVSYACWYTNPTVYTQRMLAMCHYCCMISITMRLFRKLVF